MYYQLIEAVAVRNTPADGSSLTRALSSIESELCDVPADIVVLLSFSFRHQLIEA